MNPISTPNDATNQLTNLNKQIHVNKQTVIWTILKLGIKKMLNKNMISRSIFAQGLYLFLLICILILIPVK